MRRLLALSVDYLPRALALALPAGTIVVLASGKYPHRSLAANQEALLGKVLGSPALVVGLRIVAMYVFVFTLASVIARIWNGQWLRKVGPFEVSDEVQAIKDEHDGLAVRARTAESTIEHLMAALEQANMAVVRLSDGLMEGHGDFNRPERQR